MGRRTCIKVIDKTWDALKEINSANLYFVYPDPRNPGGGYLFKNVEDVEYLSSVRTYLNTPLCELISIELKNCEGEEENK